MPSRLHLGFATTALILLALLLATPIGTTLRHRILSPSNTTPETNNPSSSTTPPTKSDRPSSRPTPTVEATEKLLRETIIADIHLKDLALDECLTALNTKIKQAGVDNRDLHIALDEEFRQHLLTTNEKWHEVELHNAPVATILQYIMDVRGIRYQVSAGVVIVSQNSSSAESPGLAYVQNRLDSIVIPVIDFDQTTLIDALEFLRQRTIDLDGESPDFGKKGLGIFIRFPPQKWQTTLPPPKDPHPGSIMRWQAKDITLRQALDEITRLTGTEWAIVDHGIVIRPKSAPPFSE